MLKNHTTILELLHRHGADLHATDKFGVTVREHGLKKKHDECVALIDELAPVPPAS